MKKPHLLLVLTIFSSGCASVASTPHSIHTHIGPIQTLSTTASVSNLIIKSDNSLQFCAQPPADATFNESEGQSFSLVTIPGSKQGEATTDSSAADEMQGRVPAVLMARELLYRLCELSINNPSQLDRIIPLYEKTLEVIEAGWLKESDHYTILDSITTTETINNLGPQTQEAPEENNN